MSSPFLEDRVMQRELVYELCANNSPMMIPLHPDLQDLMETEDSAERLEWVVTSFDVSLIVHASCVCVALV